MHFSLLSAIVFPVAAFASAQVNLYDIFQYILLTNPNLTNLCSYYDTACQNYAGTSYAELGGDSVGGPAGSSSMLFVNSDSCSDTCGRKTPLSFPLHFSFLELFESLNDSIKIYVSPFLYYYLTELLLPSQYHGFSWRLSWICLMNLHMTKPWKPEDISQYLN